jgi:hypothetical protein
MEIQPTRRHRRMKSIMYLSHWMADHLKPVLVKHDPRFPAYEHYKHEDTRYTGSLYSWKYVFTVQSGMGIHEKINLRAEHISRTNIIRCYHGSPIPPDWEDRRKIGRDYQWHVSPERIARARFRHWKRMRKTRRKCTWNHCGYACIDWSFGLGAYGWKHDLNRAEKGAIMSRLELASTSRAPLPPWSLISAMEKTRGFAA